MTGLYFHFLFIYSSDLFPFAFSYYLFLHKFLKYSFPYYYVYRFRNQLFKSLFFKYTLKSIIYNLKKILIKCWISYFLKLLFNKKMKIKEPTSNSYFEIIFVWILSTIQFSVFPLSGFYLINHSWNRYSLTFLDKLPSSFCSFSKIFQLSRRDPLFWKFFTFPSLSLA